VLLPMTEASLVLMPTLSTGPQPRALAEAPTSAVAARFPADPGNDWTSLGTTPFTPTADGSPSPENPRNNSLALSAFLDLIATEALPGNSVEEQRPDAKPDAIGSRRSPAAGGDAGAEALPAEPHAENPEGPSTAER